MWGAAHPAVYPWSPHEDTRDQVTPDLGTQSPAVPMQREGMYVSRHQQACGATTLAYRREDLAPFLTRCLGKDRRWCRAMLTIHLLEHAEARVIASWARPKSLWRRQSNQCLSTEQTPTHTTTTTGTHATLLVMHEGSAKGEGRRPPSSDLAGAKRVVRGAGAVQTQASVVELPWHEQAALHLCANDDRVSSHCCIATFRTPPSTLPLVWQT